MVDMDRLGSCGVNMSDNVVRVGVKKYTRTLRGEGFEILKTYGDW
jgi:hypothetical protein